MTPRHLLVLLLALAGVACSSGGSGGVLGDPVALAGSFLPAQPSPSDLTVSAAQSSAGGDLVTVRVDVTGTQSVFAALFEVVTPPSVQYVGWAPGALLESGGQEAAYFVTQTGSGRLAVDAARLGGDGIDVAASTALIHLTFRVTQPGSFALAFESTQLLDDGPPLPAPIGGLSWYGGTLLAE